MNKIFVKIELNLSYFIVVCFFIENLKVSTSSAFKN